MEVLLLFTFSNMSRAELFGKKMSLSIVQIIEPNNFCGSLESKLKRLLFCILFILKKKVLSMFYKLSLLVLHTFYLGIIARIWIGMSFVCLIGNRTPTLLSYFRYERATARF